MSTQYKNSNAPGTDRACTGVVAYAMIALCWTQPTPAWAETGTNDGQIQSVTPNVDSGDVSASGGGSDPVVVFSQVLTSPGAPWLRLHFKTANLSGSVSAGNASFLRLSSSATGEVQVMDADELVRWGDSSGYLAGDEVLLELLAYPNTGTNKVVVDEILAGQTVLVAYGAYAAQRTTVCPPTIVAWVACATEELTRGATPPSSAGEPCF